MTFLTNMLLGTLPEMVAPPKPKQTRAASPNHKSTVKALARYREVMGGEWVRTWEIARRLDAFPSAPQRILNRWLEKGLVERRRVPRGYEWRMK